jgi:N-acetyl-anhydromuramyl-L-alanine amidase AmpD
VPTIRFEAASRANYTVAHRPSSAIRMVVIHVTESSALGAITWFRNPRAAASANYVVSGTGAITQMVPDSDIAWHAGNWAINRESIGVEHEGYTYRPGSFTDAEYRASARLVGYELRHYLLPIDRKHVIGHNQVPDPNHPGLLGGFAHHTDPGPNWNWGLYMRYVDTYAHGSNPAPHFQAPPAAKTAPAKPQITAKVTAGKVTVSSSGLENGQTVAGYVRWLANVGSADVTRVDFLVDGRVRWTEKEKPFEFGGNDSGWDTTRETNGVHVLTLRVVAKKGATAGQSLRVVVENSPFEIASADISNGQTLKGKLRWEAVPSGAPADHVDFLLDGKVVHTENEAPFVYGDTSPIDTSTLPNGPHTLSLRAVAAD